MARNRIFTPLCLITLTFMICCQACIIASATKNMPMDISFEQRSSKETIPSNPIIVADDFDWTFLNQSAQPKIWLYLNFVIIISIPIVFTVQTIVQNKTKGKFDGKNSEEQVDSDNSVAEQHVVEKTFPISTSLPINLVKYAFLVIFIQNIAILVLYIALIVTIPQSTNNPDISLTIIRIYSILYYLDFVGALLATIGLILFASRATKNIQCYIAAGFWLAWIGLGIYPRINSVINLGIFGSTTGIDIGEWAANFYAADLFLITFGSICLAIALFNTASIFVAEKHLKGKGMINSLGIGNYIITSGFSIILLILLTYGYTLSTESIGSLGLLWIIFIFGKFLIAPVIGLIAGIGGFRQLKITTT